MWNSELVAALHVHIHQLNDMCEHEAVELKQVAALVRVTEDGKVQGDFTAKQYADNLSERQKAVPRVYTVHNEVFSSLTEGKAEIKSLLVSLMRSTGATASIQNRTDRFVKVANGWQLSEVVLETIFVAPLPKPKALFHVVVSTVPRPADPAIFRKQYISTIYLHADDPEAKERLEKTRELMYARWDWATKHTYELVNCLRLCGHLDDNIQSMCDGIRPLCFKSEPLHSEFVADLRLLKAELEKEMGWVNVGFVQSGSSVPGFSTNPLKGLAYQASKITDVNSSDVDIVLTGEGVRAWAESKIAAGVKHHRYPSTGARHRDGKIDSEERFGVKHDADMPRALATFRTSWGHKFSGGMQNTFALSPSPSLPPWETRLI